MGARQPGRCATTTCASCRSLAPLMPLGQAEERVHADDQTERVERMLGTQLAQRQHRVGRALAPHLAIVDDEARLAGGSPRAPLRAAGRRRRAVTRDAAGRLPARSALSASRNACSISNAVRRWPKWIGSKVPPKTPIGAVIVTVMRPSGTPAMRATSDSRDSTHGSPYRRPWRCGRCAPLPRAARRCRRGGSAAERRPQRRLAVRPDALRTERASSSRAVALQTLCATRESGAQVDQQRPQDQRRLLAFGTQPARIRSARDRVAAEAPRSRARTRRTVRCRRPVPPPRPRRASAPGRSERDALDFLLRREQVALDAFGKQLRPPPPRASRRARRGGPRSSAAAPRGRRPRTSTSNRGTLEGTDPGGLLRLALEVASHQQQRVGGRLAPRAAASERAAAASIAPAKRSSISRRSRTATGSSRRPSAGSSRSRARGSAARGRRSRRPARARARLVTGLADQQRLDTGDEISALADRVPAQRPGSPEAILTAGNQPRCGATCLSGSGHAAAIMPPRP